jgi:hypothetical protein
VSSNWRPAAAVATALEKLSVHVDDASRTGLLVQIVHVLATDEKAILQRAFKFGESELRGIWFGRRSHSLPHRIEFPHQPGIAAPRFGRCDLFDPVIPPKSPPHATEGWKAALGAYSGAGKNKDAVGRGNDQHGSMRGRASAVPSGLRLLRSSHFTSESLDS